MILQGGSLEGGGNYQGSGKPPLLTLLTDFGSADWYVAAVKGTVLRIAPWATIIDISHEVPPGNVETASFFLGATAFAFPPRTVHLSVVDPGVGSARRILMVEAGGSIFLAPDNGLLTPLLASAQAVRSVERPDLFLPGPGSTFHGRDRFAPVAAHLLNGAPPAGLGPEIADPVLRPVPAPRHEGSTLHGRVLHVDRFGNLVTDLPSGWLPGGSALRAEVAGHATAHRATHYRDIPPGEAAVLPGSLGTLELSLDGDDLARRWQVRRGAPVAIHLSPPPDSPERPE